MVPSSRCGTTSRARPSEVLLLQGEGMELDRGREERVRETYKPFYPIRSKLSLYDIIGPMV